MQILAQPARASWEGEVWKWDNLICPYTYCRLSKLFSSFGIFIRAASAV